MTKKQKEELRVAELRKQALLASGVQVEGLQQQGAAPKKPVYDNRKKKKGTGAATSNTASGPVTREPSPERDASSAPPQTPTKEAPAKVEGVKDDWDANSEDETPKTAEGVKDSWDDSSDDEKSASKSSSECVHNFGYHLLTCFF